MLSGTQQDIKVTSDKGTMPPSTQEYLKDRLTGLSEAKLADLYKACFKLQKHFKTQLEITYQEEFTPGYTPAWYMINKERHLTKVQLAKELKDLCSLPIQTIIDIEFFVKKVAEISRRNLILDPSGGRFDQIINSAHELMDAITNTLYEYHQNIDHVAQFITSTLHFMISDLKQRQIADSEKVNHVESFAFIFTQSSIYNTFKPLLIREIAHQFEGIINDDHMRMTRAEELVDELYKMITQDSDKLRIDAQKIEFLQSCQLPFYLITAVSQFSRTPFAAAANPEAFFAYFCRTMLILKFSDRLQFLEKELCYEKHIREMKDIDAKVYATRHQNKLDFYRETFEDNGRLDNLQTVSLIKMLKASLTYSITPESTTDKILKLIGDDFDSHEKYNLSPDKHEEILGAYLFEWTRRLRREFALFETSLRELDLALACGKSNDSLINSVITLVKQQYPSIPRPKFMTTQDESCSSPILTRGSSPTTAAQGIFSLDQAPAPVVHAYQACNSSSPSSKPN